MIWLQIYISLYRCLSPMYLPREPFLEIKPWQLKSTKRQKHRVLDAASGKTIATKTVMIFNGESTQDQNCFAKRTIFYIPRAKECQCSTHIRYNFQKFIDCRFRRSSSIADWYCGTNRLTGALPVLNLLQAVEMAALCIS